MKPDGDAGLLERVLPRYRSDPDAVELQVVVSGIGEQGQLLRDGRADLALLPAHDDLTGFDTEVLLELDHVVALPRGHRLAGREALVLADLDGEPQVHDADGPAVRDVGQLMQLIALGQLVAVVPVSARRNARADVVFVPLLDAPTTALVLAWPEGSRSRAVAAFLRACTAVVAGTVTTSG
jgi:DNA-binding transcriptional LysR family regulator